MGKGMKRGTVGGGLGEEREGPNGYRGNVADKFKFWDTPEFYHGFRHFHTTVFNRNVFDLSFEDGINRFSVFIKPADRQIEPVSTIVYVHCSIHIVKATESKHECIYIIIYF